jgi:hypothetical protein
VSRVIDRVATISAVGMFGLAACIQRATPEPAERPTESPAVELAAPEAMAARIIDLCTRKSGDPVCVLDSAGHVSCAHLDDAQFKPPLEGIIGAVELACGEHSICARDEQGSVTCLGRSGELRRIDEVTRARTLARDCAVAHDGKLHCWADDWTVGVRSLPPILDEGGPLFGHEVDLQLVDIVDEHRGCALERSGALWCWSFGDLQRYELGASAGITDLRFHHGDWCIRRDGVKLCSPGEREPEPAPKCADEPCTCSYSVHSGGSCYPQDADAATQPLDETRTVHSVVAREEPCVLDASDHVFCQPWPHMPVHEIEFVETHETTARFELVERKPPPPEPEPLPDPQTTACPAATVISNRVCEHLTSGDGPLACVSGEWTCERRCSVASVSGDPCNPDGFMTVNAGRKYDPPDYLVYVEGPRVWVGPALRRFVRVGKVTPVDGAATPTTLLEVHAKVDEGASWYWTLSELWTTVVCGFVDGEPACSEPIARAWHYQFDLTHSDTGKSWDHEEVTYEADLTLAGTDMKLEVRKGKQHVGNLEHFGNGPTEQLLEGVSVLGSGKYPLTSLLSRRLTSVPE